MNGTKTVEQTTNKTEAQKKAKCRFSVLYTRNIFDNLCDAFNKEQE